MDDTKPEFEFFKIPSNNELSVFINHNSWQLNLNQTSYVGPKLRRRGHVLSIPASNIGDLLTICSSVEEAPDFKDSSFMTQKSRYNHKSFAVDVSKVKTDDGKWCLKIERNADYISKYDTVYHWIKITDIKQFISGLSKLNNAYPLLLKQFPPGAKNSSKRKNEAAGMKSSKKIKFDKPGSPNEMTEGNCCSCSMHTDDDDERCDAEKDRSKISNQPRDMYEDFWWDRPRL